MAKKNIKKSRKPVKRKVIKRNIVKTKPLYDIKNYDDIGSCAYDYYDDEYSGFEDMPTWKFVLYMALFIIFLPLILLVVIIFSIFFAIADWADRKEYQNQNNKRR